MTRMIPTTINGRWRLHLPEHRANRAEWTTGWEVERLDAMARSMRPGDVVVDVGSEEGDLSALYSTWVSPGGHLVLVEPNPKVWPNIRVIWEANGLPRPYAFWVGFASDQTEPSAVHDADAALHRASGPDGWPLCSHGPVVADHGFCNLADNQSIPQLRLDDLAEMYMFQPDVITVDVEGSELRVLRGATQLLTYARPLVYASIHAEAMTDLYGDRESDLHAFMADVGYVGEHLATDHEAHWQWHHPDGRRPG